jgi:hypothetical protein
MRRGSLSAFAACQGIRSSRALTSNWCLTSSVIRSVKQECLSKVILFGEVSLSRVLSEYSTHYHRERNHQGKGNRLLFPETNETRNLQRRSIECRQRLGGLLKYYQRAA